MYFRLNTIFLQEISRSRADHNHTTVARVNHPEKLLQPTNQISAMHVADVRLCNKCRGCRMCVIKRFSTQLSIEADDLNNNNSHNIEKRKCRALINDDGKKTDACRKCMKCLTCKLMKLGRQLRVEADRFEEDTSKSGKAKQMHVKFWTNLTYFGIIQGLVLAYLLLK